MTTPLVAFPADGCVARWQRWDHEGDEELRLTWENEAWTAIGEVTRERITYVVRLSATWQVRQFLLFRDLADPDLWLGTDGSGRWGEVNGAHRPELDGCTDLVLECSPFPLTIPIRRLQLEAGHAADVAAARIDVETLSVTRQHLRLDNLGGARWRVTADGEAHRFGVDDYGLPSDVNGRFRRR